MYGNKKPLLYLSLICFLVAIILLFILIDANAWGQQSQDNTLIDTHAVSTGNIPPLTNKVYPNHQFSLSNPPKFSRDPKVPKAPTNPRIVITPSPQEQSNGGESK
jgi:hypothetical protein